MLIGIVGAGPAGSALACFLAERGVECLVFDNEKRPDLLVGESLVPAAIPYLRRLGIEDEVAATSAKKCGAALRHASGLRVDFQFRRFAKGVPNYSYNISRPAFDQLLQQRAKAMGVRFVDGHASVEKSDAPEREIELSEDSLRLAGLNRQPDFLVDASGRHRLFSRALSLETLKGERDDVSYFAHYSDFESDAVVDGQVVVSVIDSGWSWQIPLKNALSVGVVLDKKTAHNYGATPEQRLENIIDADPLLSKSGQGRCRRSRVVAYNNYQLISKQAYGKGWALLGDAQGFVDPMLSPGVFMALESAALLEKNMFSNNNRAISESGLKRYAVEMNDWHQSWDDIINYFYNGRLLSLIEAGQNVVKNASRWSPTRLIEWHLRRVISGMVSGAETRSKYNQKVLYHSYQHLLSDNDDADLYKMKPVTKAISFEEAS